VARRRPLRRVDGAFVLACACAAGIAGLCARAGTASAQSLSLDPMTARGIAHAGTGLVADDTAAVWWQNPAAAARREAARIIAGATSLDTDLEIEPRLGVPVSTLVNRGNSGLSPQLSFAWTLSGFTVGASLLSSQRLGRRFEGPTARTPENADRESALRYAGLAGAMRRDTISVGAARRLGDQLAVGVSFSASRLTLRETRRVWAGLENRDLLRDASRDLELSFAVDDLFIPAASAGVVLVPEDSPLELAFAASVVTGAELRGTLRAPPSEERLLAGQRRAALELPHQLVLRSGARWQAARWSAELNGQLELTPRPARSLVWQLEDFSVRDESGLVATPRQLPAQLSLRSLAHLRGAVDVEVLEGLLWLSGGAGWSPIGTSGARLTPGFADMGGTTASFGAELSAGGVTVAFGVTRTWSPRVIVAQSTRRLDNPFGAGDQMTGFGTYRSAVDIAGISLEIEAR
jgi:hypothetical protein